MAGRLIAPGDIALPGNQKQIIYAQHGDSRTANGLSGNAAAPNKTSRGLGWWLEFLSKGQVRVPYALTFGFSGYTSTQLLANLPATIAAAKAAGASGVILLGCSTNDRTNSIDYATTISNYAAMQALILAAALTCVWVSELPRGDSSFTSLALTGQNLKDHIAAEGWPQTQAGALGVIVARPWMVFSDLGSKANNDLGYAALGNTFDGLHPQALGMAKIASDLLPALQVSARASLVLPQGNVDGWTATTPKGIINTNPMLLGSGGSAGSGVTGTVAAGWTAACAAGTGGSVAGVGSIVTGSDGRSWQQFVFSGTAGSTFDIFTLRQDITVGNMGTVVGEILDAVAAFQVDAAQTGIASLSVSVADQTQATFANSGIRGADTDAFPVVALDGIARIDPAAIPAGATSVRLSANVVFKRSTAVSATVRIGQVAARAA